MKKFFALFIFFLLVGCAEPLPDDKKDYVGLWQNNQTSLLITQDGLLEFETNKGAINKSISFPIISFTNSEIVSGFLFIETKFKLSGPPIKKDGLTILNVDGEDLYKIGNDGKVILSLEVPSLENIRKIVTNDLNLLSDGISKKDFSEYLSFSSLQFQSQFDSQKLLEANQAFIEQGIILKQWMEGDFVLVAEPEINEDGILTVSGKYPTSPNSLKFTLKYVYSDNVWKSLGPKLAINNKE